jgi:hypothetical protein
MSNGPRPAIQRINNSPKPQSRGRETRNPRKNNAMLIETIFEDEQAIDILFSMRNFYSNRRGVDMLGVLNKNFGNLFPSEQLNKSPIRADRNKQ